MALSKRLRRIFEDREAKLNRFQEQFPPPKREIPPYTKEEKERYDRIEAILDEIIYDMSRDPDLIRELVSLTGFLNNSARWDDLNRKIKHYMTLTQDAAKDNLWRKMCSEAYRFRTEVDLSRTAREAAGKGIQ
jgi:hypothetical protein